MTNFESVKKFMHTFGQEVRTKAGFPNDKIIALWEKFLLKRVWRGSR